MLFLIEIGKWEFKVERHPSPPEQVEHEHVPQPMTVYTPDFVGFIPARIEDGE